MSIRTQRLMISSFFLPLSWDSFTTFLSPIPSLPTSHSCVPLTPLPLSGVLYSFARGNLNWNSHTSSFYRSIHLCSFFFNGWNDTWGHHGIACTHRCSPGHSQRWVVSGKHPCWSYRTITGCDGWLHSGFLSRGIWGWEWWLQQCWWCWGWWWLAGLVMMRCLLDLLAFCHSWQKRGVVLRWK